MKRRYEYIDLEEGMILMGYSIDRDLALSLMNRRAKRECGDRMTESPEDLHPIYELTKVTKDYGEETFIWKDKPDRPDQRILGWAFLA